MVCRGKGEDKEYCDRVIKDVLSQWDRTVCNKTTNQMDQEGEGEHEID